MLLNNNNNHYQPYFGKILEQNTCGGVKTQFITQALFQQDDLQKKEHVKVLKFH